MPKVGFDEGALRAACWYEHVGELYAAACWQPMDGQHLDPVRG